MDQEKFLQQLQIVLNPSQGDVKEATGTLQKEFYTNPAALLFLIQLFTSQNNTDLKQLAAVEARTLVSKHWLKVPREQKPPIREQLLRSTLEEQAPLVRHAGARIISAIAKIDLQDGEWADLPQWLLQAATNNSKDVRAVGMYILFTILETLGDGFQSKFVELLQLFDKTIRDPESFEVRINTLLCLSKLALHIDADEDEQPVQAFQSMVPAMVAVLKDSVDQEEEDRIMQAFEVFQTLLGCEPQLLNRHLKDLVLFMIQLASNTELAEETRTQAINFLMQCLRYRKLKIQGMQLGEQLTRTCLQIATELGDSSEEDDITPARTALGLLDMLAQFLPPSQVVVPLLKSLGQYFTSTDPDYRQAGIMALGMCVEGAPDFISTQMNEIFPVVLKMLSDHVPKVRRATLQVIARIADELAEDVRKEHQRLMPLLTQNLGGAMQEYKGEDSGPVLDIIRASLASIGSVVEVLEEKELVVYQAELIPMLQKLFQHPDFKIKALCAAALGSVASSAPEAFLPYFDESMHIMQEYATLKNSQEELELRASVTDAMGEMSVSAGPERYKNYVGPLMQASEEALSLDHSRLKESTYILWGAMSKLYGEDFAPYLDGVVKGIFDCLEQEEDDLEISLGDAARDLVGQEVNIAGHKVRVADADDDDDDVAIEGMDGDDDDDDWEDFSTVTPIALEKEIAIEVLGDVVTHTGKAFMPFFEKAIEHVLPLAEHPYEGVRRSTISTLHRAYAALWQISEEGGHAQKWKPGMSPTEPPQEIKKFGEILMTATVKMWAEEEDSTTVADINRNVAENLRYCGPYIASDPSNLERVTTLVDTIISKEHPCQQDFGAGEEDQAALEELSEFDWVVIDTALDIISALATCLGSDFIRIWPMFEKKVLKFAAGSESLERSTAVGVLADTITGVGEAISPYTANFLRLFMRRVTDEDFQARSNACYAIGRLVEKSNSNQEIIQAYPSILEKLEPCLRMDKFRLPDNALGCLARMILKHKDHVPLSDAIPAMIDALPLTMDYEENDPIFHMICQLYKWEDPVIQSHTARLIPIFQSVLMGDADQLEPPRRSEVIELVSWLNRMQPGGPASFIEQVQK